ncbi:MAG: T9SS C-terminal target domain-containing protein, partial [Chitinophagia bacterium]|nr:T9SS C-terminal target domain-containing protein [Chitinophagia bacterium]
FNTPGWVDVTVTATGNHSGDSTIKRSDVYVTERSGTSPSSYFQEFDPAGDVAKWPTFNYYNNEFKWEMANVGLYDGYSLKYHGYDDRLISGFPTTGVPYGDYDDMFSIPFDLTSMATGPCNLNFYSSGASRSSNSNYVNDTLQIDYSTDSAKTWKRLTTISKGDLCNRGVVNGSFVPGGVNDWRPQTVAIPTAARTSYTLFRFRYRPGTDNVGYTLATGNNFYMDRIHFSPYAAEVSGIPLTNEGITIAPNPTAGNAFVVVRNSANSAVKIVVTDISGKTVYSSEEALNNGSARIEIPASAISAKGIYIVQTISGGLLNTQKLVVY